MHALPYILPWLLLLLAAGLAVAAKLLPLKSPVGGGVIGALALLFIGVCLYANIVSSQQHHHLEEKEAALAEVEEWKYKHLDELSLLIAQLKPPSDEEATILKELSGYGWLTTHAVVRQMRDAHRARDRILAEFTPTQPMLLKGVPPTVNEKIVELSLRQVGFTVIPFKPDETRDPDINILYFGRDLNINEVKLAAFTLMQAGIDLKGIKPFPKPTQGNLRAIKLEWNKYYEVRKGMTVTDVEIAKAFN
ncbi:MAG TPA: hypothetical protein VM553_21215 [Dongiaceae bacterium]|nr:hypothetical protein [Dongiaceae bacterium]